MPPTLTPTPSRGKRLSQMGGEMLNFPADDLAVLFTPHLWPSVTFYTGLSPPGLGTATAKEWRHDLKAGGPPSSATNSSYLLGAPPRIRTDPFRAALGDRRSLEKQWGTETAQSCPQGHKGFGSLQNALDSPKPPANFLFSHLAPSFPNRDLQPE